jgi:outer membrane protein assembly factor BamA
VATPDQELADLEAAGEPAGPEVERAARIVLVLPPGQEEAAVRPLLAVKEGQPVTARALRRTAIRLFQSGRCRDVVVRQREAPARQPPGNWVDLTVTCLGHRQVAALEVQQVGPSPVGDQAVRSAAALEPGAPADDPDLEAAAVRVRTLLRRRGHREPEVTVQATDERAAVVKIKVAAGPPTRLTALQLQGAGALEQPLARVMALRPGATLDEEKLAADLTALRRELHRTGRWRARVGRPVERTEAGGVAVTIKVEPGPPVELRFRGAEAFTPAELRSQLALNPEQPFDRLAVETAQERLRSFYRAHGYAAAQVAAEEQPAGQTLYILFHLAEGRRHALGRIAWQGLERRTPAALDASLLELLKDETPPFQPLPGEERARLVETSVPGTAPLRQPPPLLAPGHYLDEVILPRALEGIVEDYRADGYLDAVVLGWSADLDGRRGEADVTVRLREGRRTTVEAIEFSGQQAIPLAELTRDAALSPGDPLVWEKVKATQVALLNRYRGRSYLYARVEVKQLLDADPARAQARLRFEIEEGPQVRIGRILVSGHLKTREAVIRGALAVREGALYDPGSLDRSQAALLRLGVFRSVGLRLQDPEVAEPVKDLLVEVSERPWQTVTAGVGFSLANGPRVGLEWSRPNLLGRALELTALGKLNYPLAYFRPDLASMSAGKRYEGRGDVALRVPRLEFIPWPATARTSLVAERQHRPSYDLSRASLVGSVEMPLTPRFTFTVQDEVEVDDIANTSTVGALTQADLNAKRFPVGTTTLNSVSAAAAFDLRDNAANPHRGGLALGSVEYIRGLGSKGGHFLFLPGSENDADLVKLQASLSGYLPLGTSTVLAASVRGGRIFPVTGGSKTIYPKRFFLGGAGTMRGYSEDAMVPQDQRGELAQLRAHCLAEPTAADCTKDPVTDGYLLANRKTVVSQGGQAFLLGKVEVRQAMLWGLELGLFLDFGNLWFEPGKVRLDELRPNAGVGLRAVTPVGPLVFDFGFNLRPDKNLNEPTFAPHFTIGLF